MSTEEFTEAATVLAEEELPLPSTSLRDWLLLPFFLLGFLLILVVFDVWQRIAFARGRSFHERAVVQLNRALQGLLEVFGAKIELRNFAELTPGRPYVIVSNHQSLFDIPILHSVFADHFPRFISKKELARWIPSVSYNLQHGENAIIDRANAQQAIDQIGKLGSLLMKRGFAVVIFPEGTRARRGKLKQFRYAGFATLIQSAPLAQVVPVTIDGSWKLSAHKHLPIPLRTKVTVVVGAPIDHEQHGSLKEMMTALHYTIEQTLERLRGEPKA